MTRRDYEAWAYEWLCEHRMADRDASEHDNRESLYRRMGNDVSCGIVGAENIRQVLGWLRTDLIRDEYNAITAAVAKGVLPGVENRTSFGHTYSACCYLTKDGHACVVGCRLDADEQKAATEWALTSPEDGSGVLTLFQQFPKVADRLTLVIDVDTWADLQLAHDSYATTQWNPDAFLKGVAKILGIQQDSPEENSEAAAGNIGS